MKNCFMFSVYKHNLWCTRVVNQSERRMILTNRNIAIYLTPLSILARGRTDDVRFTFGTGDVIMTSFW